MSSGFLTVTKDGKLCGRPNEAIFPILKQLNDDRWQLIGTAFFITNTGIFLTAKHVLKDVLDDCKKQIYPISAFLFPVQEVCQISRILKGFLNLRGDIAAGIVSNINAEGVLLKNPFLGLSCGPINIGDKVFTYAYPRTICSGNNINFRAEYYKGKVELHYPDGRDSMLPDPCYQTNMEILGGASGGPVFNTKGAVIGVNSTGFNLGEGDPISFVSDIERSLDIVLEDINLPCGSRDRCTIRELAELGYVSVDLDS